MIRVSTFTIPDSDGGSIRFASMSVAEAEAFVEDGRKLLARRDDVSAQEWLSRRNATIIASLKKAKGIPQNGTLSVSTGEGEISESDLKNEFDNPTLDALYRAILTFSGLNPGEAPAATASASSAAA